MPKAGHILNIIENLGSIQHFSVSATTDIKVPSTGTALAILAFFYYCNADITSELRFKTSQNVIGGRSEKGPVGMNLIGRKPPQGSADEIVEIYLSGAGTAKGWICFQEV